MISRLIQSASIDMKMDMETLLNGGEITVCFDEQIVFSQLENDENAVWSLMVASGYLKVCEVEYRGMMGKPWYHLAVTNMETLSMFTGMFTGWFADKSTNYSSFVKAFISGNVKEMNIYMNDVALSTISNFDSGMHPSSVSEPERFYHGLVLGLLSELYDTYEVKSNRESGYGRYDVMVIPKIDKQKDAMILEFKVCDIDTEGTLEDTAEAALQQIKERQYDAELIARGIDRKKIVFSEEIDSSINGIALGTAFVMLSIFVVYFKIFNNTIAEKFIAVILLELGIAGTLTEIGRIKKEDIKGLDDLIVGVLLTVVSVVVILKFRNVALNIGLFIVLLLGSYGMIRGILEILYSLKLQRRKSNNVKIEIMKIVVAVTEFISLIVVILQLVKELV